MDSPLKNAAGVLLVDKPQGMTSHDVVDRIRKVARTRRVGHTGTLDPMAEGLLVVCIGGATRISQFLVGFPKEYHGTIRLGAMSSTYDAEGAIEEQDRPVPTEPEAVREAMRIQIGWQMQLPPPYSAVRVAGKRLYEYARKGEAVPRQQRRVHINRFDLADYEAPSLRFRAQVGSGTYIRSMAHDLGIQLGCGGYLSSLRRTRVGHFSLGEAVTIPELIENPDLLGFKLLGIADALAHLPKITLSDSAEQGVLHGRGFTARDILASETIPRPAETSLVVSSSGTAISIVRGELKEPAGREPGFPGADHFQDDLDRLWFKPIRVLAPEASGNTA